MTAHSLKNIGIIGGGSWGTALAQVVRSSGKHASLWVREKEIAEQINLYHQNPTYLPGVKLDVLIKAVLNISDLAMADALLLVVPAQHMRDMCQKIMGRVPHNVPLVICAKGIELKTGLLMSEVVREALPHNPLAVLSGPTFAAEVVAGKPAAVTLAAKDEALALQLAEQLGNERFRTYFSTDLVGVQIGGALKNVLAIAAGIVIGRGLGENARAALITRGLSEIIKFSQALGARSETLMGLSGLGDIVLTCTSLQSRNTALGMALGGGQNLDICMQEQGNRVMEGVSTAKAVLQLSQKHGIEMPIVQCVSSILHEGVDIDQAVQALLARPFRSEG